MDILAHMLWTNYGAQTGNKQLQKKNKRPVNLAWVTFWGVFPDLFAFTIPFIIVIFSTISGDGTIIHAISNHHGMTVHSVNTSAVLYQYSHSLVIWALVFVIAWIISKRPRLELLGWALHVLIDIPSHALAFFPTPFLFPISNYRFPYGVPWSNLTYMIINYSLLLVVSIYIFRKKKRAIVKSSPL